MKHNTFYRNLVRFIIAVGLVLAVYNKITFKDSIYNPDNAPYILECAFNLDKPAHLITQKEFNRRYTK